MPLLYTYLLNIKYGKEVYRLHDIDALRSNIYATAMSQATYDCSVEHDNMDGQRKSRVSASERLTRIRDASERNLRSVLGRSRRQELSAASEAMIQERAKDFATLTAEEEMLLKDLPDFAAKLIAGYRRTPPADSLAPLSRPSDSVPMCCRRLYCCPCSRV